MRVYYKGMNSGDNNFYVRTIVQHSLKKCRTIYFFFYIFFTFSILHYSGVEQLCSYCSHAKICSLWSVTLIQAHKCFQQIERWISMFRTTPSVPSLHIMMPLLHIINYNHLYCFDLFFPWFWITSGVWFEFTWISTLALNTYNNQ